MKPVGAEKAKILRARRRLDPDEQYDDEEFEEKFKEDPFSALSKIEEKQKRSDRNIQKQVNYFGHVIEPFNMKNEQDMGNLDAEGFFVFTKKKGDVKDAWLDSLEIGNQQQLLQGIQKKILETKKPLPVDKKAQLTDQEDAEDNASIEDDEDSEEFMYERQKPVKKKKLNDPVKQETPAQPEMTPSEIKYLLSELLPDKTHCANYLKQLKPVKKPTFKKNVRKSEMKEEAAKPDDADLQQHDRILELCHLYIRQTGDHGIMTTTKEQLAKEIAIDEKKAAGVQIVDNDEQKQQKDQDDVF